jgi:hypothetical protein
MSRDRRDDAPRAAFDPEAAEPPTGLGRLFVYFKIGITVGAHVLTLAVLVFATDRVLSRPVVLGILVVVNVLAVFLWRGELKHLTPPEEFEDRD